jgi:hypothetical protein
VNFHSPHSTGNPAAGLPQLGTRYRCLYIARPVDACQSQPREANDRLGNSYSLKRRDDDISAHAVSGLLMMSVMLRSPRSDTDNSRALSTLRSTLNSVIHGTTQLAARYRVLSNLDSLSRAIEFPPFPILLDASHRRFLPDDPWLSRSGQALEVEA